MPRYITERDPIPLFNGAPGPGQVYEKKPYMIAPKGMYATIEPHQADPNIAIIAKNLFVNSNGKYEVRRPMTRNFYDPTINCIGAIGVTKSNASCVILLFHETGVKYSTDGVTFNDCTGPDLSGGTASGFSLINWAMWGSDKLLFTTDASLGAPELYELDLTTFIYALIAASPTAQVMSVFGGRVLVADKNSRRLTWCVKDDNTDWAGLGSGFEDLPITPGNESDNLLGVFPVDDSRALVVRTGSVWIAATTGNVDAPYRFDPLYRVRIVNTQCLAYSSNGIFALGLDDVYLLTVNEPTSIGQAIIGALVSNSSMVYNYEQAKGTYDPLGKTYCLTIPYTPSSAIASLLRLTDSGSSSDTRETDSTEARIVDYQIESPAEVWAFNERRGLWTYLSYWLNLKSISTVNFLSPPIKGLIFTTNDNQLFTSARTDLAIPNDGDDEYDFNNTYRTIEAEILTGALGVTDDDGTFDPAEDMTLGGIELDLTTALDPAISRRVFARIYRARSGPRVVPNNAITIADKTKTDVSGRVLELIRYVKAGSFWQLHLLLSKCPTYVINGINALVKRGSAINK